MLIENVQLRICSKQWDLGYEELLSILIDVPTLQSRRLSCSQTVHYMYKIVHNLISFPSSVFVPRPGSNHVNAFFQPFAHTNAFLCSFVPSTISIEFTIYSNITNALTVPVFKSHLATYLM